MILSSDELDILEYLKSWKGTSVSLIEVCRSAGGRQRFRESPGWANSLMARLVEAKLIAVNDRGHYCYRGEEDTQLIRKEDVMNGHSPLMSPLSRSVGVVGEDYFPAS